MSKPASQPRAAKSGRRIGRPPRFTRDGIVAAALALLAELGLERLSMRRVAESLDTTQATLYRHVVNHDELVARVVDAAVAELELPAHPGPAGRRQWLLDACGAFRAGMLRYPGVADHLLLNGPTGPAGLSAMGRICAVLAETGRTPAQVAWAYDWLMTTVAAYASKQDRLDRAGGAGRVAGTLAERSRHHGDPYLAQVLAEFTGDMTGAFERTTRMVVDALVPGDPQVDPTPPPR